MFCFVAVRSLHTFFMYCVKCSYWDFDFAFVVFAFLVNDDAKVVNKIKG